MNLNKSEILIDFWVKNFFSSFLLKMMGNGQKTKYQLLELITKT